MDYKYIEQLMDRYWEGQTSQEEERLLQVFFQQKQLPAHLAKYKDLFLYTDAQRETSLGADFDEKVLSAIQISCVEARRNTWTFRLRPFYRAAAMVAVVFTLGMAVQHSWETQDSGNASDATYNYASYKDTYSDPQMAYEQVASTLKEVSDTFRNAGVQPMDSIGDSASR